MTFENYKAQCEKEMKQFAEIGRLQSVYVRANDNVEKCDTLLNYKVPRDGERCISLVHPEFSVSAHSKKDGSKMECDTEKKTIYLPDGMAEDIIIKMREHYVNEVNHRKADFVKYLNSIGIDDAEDAVSFGVKL